MRRAKPSQANVEQMQKKAQVNAAGSRPGRVKIKMGGNLIIGVCVREREMQPESRLLQRSLGCLL